MRKKVPKHINDVVGVFPDDDTYRRCDRSGALAFHHQQGTSQHGVPAGGPGNVSRHRHILDAK